MSYDYREAVKDDVLEYIKNEIDFTDFSSIEELEEKLNDELFNEDSVTGNASGSYTFNTWDAEENIAHNWDLLEEALGEFGGGEDPISNGAEWCDVTIRCHVLGQAIEEAIGEIEEEFEEANEEIEEEEEEEEMEEEFEEEEEIEDELEAPHKAENEQEHEPKLSNPENETDKAGYIKYGEMKTEEHRQVSGYRPTETAVQLVQFDKKEVTEAVNKTPPTAPISSKDDSRQEEPSHEPINNSSSFEWC